jgi:hypothetical protein
LKKIGPSDVDTTNLDPQYWAKILGTTGGSIQSGRAEHLVTYRGDLRRLGAIEEEEFRKQTGRAAPSGRGPEV